MNRRQQVRPVILGGVLLLAALGCSRGDTSHAAEENHKAGCCSGGGHSEVAQLEADQSGGHETTHAPRSGRGHKARGMHKMGKGKGCGGCGGGGGRRGVMHNAMTLVHNNNSIQRIVEEIPGGVRTVTTTSDPAMLETLRRHPREMQELYERGGSVRHWDPLFVELAKHQKQIRMTFTDIEDGIEVESVSDHPDVTALIRAHAYKVNEFVTRGRAAAHESTPLPEGYSPE